MTRARCAHLAISGDLKRGNVSEFCGGKFPKDLPRICNKTDEVNSKTGQQ
jgi:hypothetical protein